MNKSIVGLFLFFITGSSFSQNPVFFEQQGDTVIFYLSCNGSLTFSDHATYKRTGFFDEERLTWKGNVTDYYIQGGTIALKAKYRNGFYEGPLTNYHKTGIIKEAGNFKNKIRDSIWTFYNKNQMIEKKIDYCHSQQKLMEYYDKKGEPIFLDGNGKYKGSSNKDYFTCDQYRIEGEVKDGLMVGRWTINLGYSVSSEVFENGKFIRGHETPYNRTYENAALINPAGFPYYENITLLDYIITWKKDGYYWLTYNKLGFEKGFLFDLEEKIKDSIVTSNFFYALLEFQLDDGVINPESFNSITNNPETVESIKKLILSMDKWDKSEDKVTYMIYLPIFWENGLIYLKPDDISRFY
jgi:antitoxin component YwqK of YwqJK toxin-antitoxin module